MASEQSEATPSRPVNGARGIPLFRVFGIQIRLDWSWLIIFFVMVLLLRQYFATTLMGEPGWAVWALAAISVVALFACVLAHELGHSLVAIRHGVQMFDITLFIFGGMARLRGEPRTPAAELKIALAGPAVTVVIGAAFWLAYFGLVGRVNAVVSEGLRYLASVNTVLLIFNMIPGFPLDGGRVLRAVLWKTRGNLLSATRSAAFVGKAFGMVLIVFGLLLIISNLANFVPGMFQVFLGWFLASAANQSVQHLQVRQMLEMFHVADAMQRNVISVPPEITLDRLINEGFYRFHFRSFPVVSEGKLIGTVGLHAVQQVAAHLWGNTRVAEVMQPAEPVLSIRPDDGLYEAFRRMSEEDVGRLIVVDYDGRLVGMITRRDIMRLLQIYTELNPAIGRGAAQRADAEGLPARGGGFVRGGSAAAKPANWPARTEGRRSTVEGREEE